jgi:PEGA domain
VEEAAVEKQKIAVDPMMAEGAGAAGNKGVSFSDLEELPPLKEVYVAPPAPKEEAPAEEERLPSIVFRAKEPEKPKVQPREVAEKAIKEIKAVPPKLMLYSISGAVALILVIGGAVFWHSHSQNTDEDGGPVNRPVAATPAPEPATAPTPAQTQAPPEPTAGEAQQAEPAPEEPTVDQPVSRKVAALAAKARASRNKKSAAPAPAAIPGQLIVDSTPEGAQIQVDGRGDPSWITPYTIAALLPGSHTVVISKAGYGQETRTADVTSANRTSIAIHLAALTTTMVVSSDPPGATIFVDSKDTLKVTPSQITLDKGTHTILVRKAGYLDETTSATSQPGQTFRFAPTLRALGNVDEIKTVGKFKKLFGGNGAQAGMSKVSIKTTPRGAQIAINRRMLEKTSPVEILLGPGNYIVDLTLTGYKPVQKVITVEQNGNVAIDETLQAQ